jgi:hypothetical protein
MWRKSPGGVDRGARAARPCPRRSRALSLERARLSRRILAAGLVELRFLCTVRRS